MASLDDGKVQITAWVKQTWWRGGTCLDVGACDGKWFYLLGDYLRMDAIEIFAPNIEKFYLKERYNKVFHQDIRKFCYPYYDYVIFGDVLEHLSIEDAQKVLSYANHRCQDLIIAVPFLYDQEELDGNINEIHIQNDLTEEIFNERYPGYELLWSNGRYAYYHKDFNGNAQRL